MRKLLLAACALLPFATACVAIPVDPSTSAYQNGARDRDRWENWFSGLYGEKRTGAEYYATWRNKVEFRPCSVMSGHDTTWYSGCVEAQEFLRPVDWNRLHNAQYWNGWNKKGEAALAYVPTPAPSYAPSPGIVRPEVVPEDSAPVTRERAMFECIRTARGMVGLFDAYYDPQTSKYHSQGRDGGWFYFRKCMSEHGFGMED